MEEDGTGYGVEAVADGVGVMAVVNREASCAADVGRWEEGKRLFGRRALPRAVESAAACG